MIVLYTAIFIHRAIFMVMMRTLVKSECKAPISNNISGL